MRNLFVFSIFILVFTGCKKHSDPAPRYAVTFEHSGTKENLVPYHCSIQPSAVTPTKTDFMLMARSADSKNHFAIAIQVDGDFHTGTYAFGNTDCIVISDYLKEANQPGERDFSVDNAPGRPNCSFVVNITSIEESEVRGNFSANYMFDRLNNEFIELPEGTFTAKKY